ncbi:MAG TPA: helix-turn-helix domain-containing protein [Phormidium sp.]
MNRKRYITELTESEQQALAHLIKTGTTHRERQRAQAILWSSQGKDMQTLLAWLQVDRDTLSSWFTRWQTGRIAGLKDKPKNGRKKKITQEEEKKQLFKHNQA